MTRWHIHFNDGSNPLTIESEPLNPARKRDDNEGDPYVSVMDRASIEIFYPRWVTGEPEAYRKLIPWHRVKEIDVTGRG